MTRTIWLCALIIFLGRPATADEQMSGNPLVVKIGQAGFAGETGTIYTVDQNGAWESRGFINATKIDPIRSGQLTAAQLDDIKALLCRRDFVSSHGAAPEVNPVILEVKIGDRHWTVVLPANTDLAAGCEGKSGCAVMELGAYLQKELGVND